MLNRIRESLSFRVDPRMVLPDWVLGITGPRSNRTDARTQLMCECVCAVVSSIRVISSGISRMTLNKHFIELSKRQSCFPQALELADRGIVTKAHTH
jgi:hypothetical protein